MLMLVLMLVLVLVAVGITCREKGALGRRDHRRVDVVLVGRIGLSLLGRHRGGDGGRRLLVGSLWREGRGLRRGRGVLNVQILDVLRGDLESLIAATLGPYLKHDALAWDEPLDLACHSVGRLLHAHEHVLTRPLITV